MPESQYPEHEKLHEIADESQTIGEFLEWAQQQGVRLMHWWEADVEELCGGNLFEPCIGGKKAVNAYVDDEWKMVAGDRDCRVCGGTGHTTTHRAEYREKWHHISDALAEFFEIDQAKIEQEKRAMLEKLSAAHG